MRLGRYGSGGYGLAVAALFFLAGVFPLGNSDTYGHLAQGRYIAKRGLPHLDPFSYFRAEPAPWNNYEWLSDWITWLVYDLVGPSGLVLAKCTLLAVTGFVLTRQPWRGSDWPPWLAAALLCIALPGARFRATARPHLVAWVFGAAYVHLLARLLTGELVGRARPLAMLALVAMQAMWVNLHGSHLLGLGFTTAALVASWWATDTRKRSVRRSIALVWAGQLLASGCSPFGYAIVSDAIEHVFNPVYRQMVTEWRPYAPTMPVLLLALPTLWTLLLLAAARPLIRLGPQGIFLAGISLALALLNFRSIRFAGDYLLLSVPALTAGLSPRMGRLQARWPRWLAPATLLAALLWLPVGFQLAPKQGAFRLGEDLRGLPAATGQWLRDHAPRARVLASIDAAWFLLFAAPDAKQLIDGRIPFYGPEHFGLVQAAYRNASDFEALVERYRVEALVLRHSLAAERALLGFVARHEDYRLVLVENDYTLFLRATAAPEAYLDPLDGLPPSFTLTALYQEDTADLLGGLSAMLEHPNSLPYRAWNRALLELRHLRRPGRGNGLRPPRSPREVAALQSALRNLTTAASKPRSLPIIEAYRGLVLTALCRLEDAEAAFARAAEEAPSREVLLGMQEIAIRRGNEASVTAFLDEASRVAGAEDDVWLAALRDALESHRRPPCP